MSGTVFQGATEVSFGERDNVATVTILRTGDLSDPVDVTYDVTSESATPGADFVGSSGAVRFEAGQDRATISFELLDDAASERTETFVVSLVSAEGASLSVPRTCRINILDDESPVLPPASPPLDSDYRVIMQAVVTGLSQPINVEFSPTNSNLVYVAEKSGLIRVSNVSTGTDQGVFIDLRNHVNNYSDRGLMDLAVHPDFEDNPYVYAFYVVDPPEAAAQGMLDGSGNRYAQVVRYTADAATGYTTVVPNSSVVIAGGAGTSMNDISGKGSVNFSTSPSYNGQPSSERYLNPTDATPPEVIDGIKQDYIKVDSTTHAGGSLAFGPDGMLYISTGDGTAFNFTDPHTLDVQNLNSLSGKILRVDPLTGQGLTDNPFYEDGQSLNSNVAKVFQYGLRNPFSMAFDPLGQLFVTDTGWNSYEEVNSGEAGANFGWPFYEGREGGRLQQTSGYSSLPQAAAFYQAVADGTIQVKPPYAAFAHAAGVAGFQNQAITGGSVIYTGDRYPAELQGDYFFSDFPTGQVFTVDSLDRLDVNYLYKSPGAYAPVHFFQGPDGYVYYVDLGAYGPSSSGSVGRLLIFPEDGPIVTASASSPVTEGPGSASTVTFSLNTAQVAPVTVTYSTVNGTAKSGSDFAGRTNATVVIPAGQLSASVSLPILDNAISESTEIFTVAINGATLSGAAIAFGQPVGVAILDNEPAAGTDILINGSFEATSVPAGGTGVYKAVTGWTVNGGRIEIWNNYKGTPAAEGSNLVELDYGTVFDGFYQNVRTVAGQAYDLSMDMRLQAAAAASSQGVQVLWNGVAVATTTPGANWGTFRVQVTGTGGLDRLTLQEVSGQSDGRGALIDNVRLVISDAELPPKVTASASSPVTEGSGSASTVTFSLNTAQVAPVTVTYSTVDGTAVAGSDFEGRIKATVVIPAGELGASVVIPVFDDAVFESTESFAVAINGATLNGAAIAYGPQASVTVADNDPPPPTEGNLLVNGSFEATSVPAGGTGVYTAVTGWTAVTGGRFELWNNRQNIVAPDGKIIAELDYGTTPRDGFYQNVRTVAGQAYDLSMDMRLQAAAAASSQGVQVLWNGVAVATTTPGANWGTFRVQVTGTGGLDRLTLQEVSGQSDGRGALIDNVRLVISDDGTAAADSFVWKSNPESIAVDDVFNAVVPILNAASKGIDDPDDFSPAFLPQSISGIPANPMVASASHADLLATDAFLFV